MAREEKGLNQVSDLLSPITRSMSKSLSKSLSSFAITRSMLIMDEEFPGHLLHQSCLWGNHELLKDLLTGEQAKYINSIDNKGRTALHAAVSCDSIECVQILLTNGADPNIDNQAENEGNYIRKNPLHIAAENGNVAMVKLLIDHKADVLAKDGNGFTPMDIAEQYEHYQVMKILKQAVDELEQARHQLYESLCVACSKGNISEAKYILEQLDYSDAEVIVNTTTTGSNTLLFRACQDGYKDIVQLLLDYGADGRIHPVTKYSPLYISAYHGRKEITEIILEKFPKLVQVATVEKWLPIHAAAINNHLHIIQLLLKYPYPNHIMTTLIDKAGKLQYQMPFDINSQDVTGQTVLYVASLVGNQKLVDFILQFKVEAKENQSDKCDDNCDDVNVKNNNCKNNSPKKTNIPTKNVRSPSIQKLIDQLSPGNSKSFPNTNTDDQTTMRSKYISPVHVDIYCNNNTETALHAAVKKKHYSIASALLLHGANPNLLILSNESLSEDITSTALKEACLNRDSSMADLLVRHGARDDDCVALKIASTNQDNHLISKILSLKAHPDPEYKINKKAFQFGSNSSGIGFVNNVTFSSMFPTTPVMINWHALKGGLMQIRKQWLVDAAVAHNIKLKLNIQNQITAITAITRLDLSSNGLRQVPLCIFQMHSLKILNLSQNKLCTLPESDELSSPTSNTTSQSYSSSNIKKSRSYSSALTSSSLGLTSSLGWILPCLEELYLQDNQLECLPVCIFDLPALQLLDLSNNKLHNLPYKMWSAPKLRELNVSFNLLRDLPSKHHPHMSDKNLPSNYTNKMEINVEKSARNQFLYLSITKKEEEKPVTKKEEEKTIFEEEESSENKIKTNNNLRNHELKHVNLWSQSIEITANSHDQESSLTKILNSHLVSLNLSHNGFTQIPPSLSCLAVNLTRLNLSYNCLSSLGSVKNFPVNLKHVDLSQNQISEWFKNDYYYTSFYIDSTNCFSDTKSLSLEKLPINKQGKMIFCTHKQHSKLENLRTLILANNKLNSIILSNDSSSDQNIDEFESIDTEGLTSKSTKHLTKLLFPNLSMLDISNNNISEVPVSIAELTNLSVLNLNGNHSICNLPPEMGLLNKLWNLSTRGCNLNEPLKTMLENKKYKTMDIIGYLKSILENAKSYARMKLMIVGVQGIGKTSLLETLRLEGTGSYRRKQPEHWGKRMGNRNLNMKTPRGVTLSTVGVDVNDWIYEKKIRGHSRFGPVTFRTWDFGGQKEYYATHQYFLSKRSLYLVVWKITDGEKGVDGIFQWLVNIQARAPNAPVLIIGTHYDIVKEQFPSFYSEELQQMIRERFINVVDPDKCGLPKVIDTIEVSIKTKHNIKLLCNLIYDTVFELRCPGSKERLLEQKIPATYLALEECVSQLAYERKLSGYDPVLRSEQYKNCVMEEMINRFNMTFRDVSELNQATSFLHENGVLLHYEDATLKDLYFLDPQWLCDMLAHVVTIREINPYAKNGIMKTSDLRELFKNSTCAPSDAQTYILNLLNKFEVALTWDSRTLLIPSLLPSEENMRTHPGCEVKIPVRSRNWGLRKFYHGSPTKISTPAQIKIINTIDTSPVKRPNLLSIDEIQPMVNQSIVNQPTIKDNSMNNQNVPPQILISVMNRPSFSICRLLLMTYFPSGFWSRLIARMIGDDSIFDIIRSYYVLPKEVQTDNELLSIFNNPKDEWVCWQTGLGLKYLDNYLIRIKEVIPSLQNTPCDYYHMKFLIQQENKWNDININKSSLLEIYLPNQHLKIQKQSEDGSTKTFILESNQEYVTKLLALTVDHMDTLLEDWYPTLGTRFVHTSEGKFLVTRLVPCTSCLISRLSRAQFDLGSQQHNRKSLDDQDWQLLDLPEQQSHGSYGSDTSKDSGMGQELHSRVSSIEGYQVSQQQYLNETEEYQCVYSFMVEECILTIYLQKTLECPIHGELSMKTIAPDTAFVDLSSDYLIKSQDIRYGKLLGRGAFGFVFRASVKQKNNNDHSMVTNIDVAMKMLQPVDPKIGASQSDLVAYKAAINKWERDPMQYACKAYCTARQELSILLTLKHPHIVPLIGLCIKPLALVLRLAPYGSLDNIIKDYSRSGAQFSAIVLQQIILQVAKALEYLHQQHIIYRDLKSENVLVWQIPLPFSVQNNTSVDVKLADYGISRSTLPTGTKGFGGTEGFMAPEIMKYNGEEEYTEKVDCFSFGMFMYELLTLRLPFENQECVKEHVLDGRRPFLTQRDLLYPNYFIDLMTLCWSQQPKERPSISQIVSIISAPEFNHLLDVTLLEENYSVLSSAGFQNDNDKSQNVLISRIGKQTDVLKNNGKCWCEYETIITSENITVTSICIINHLIWLGDSKASIHIYSSDTYDKIEIIQLDPKEDQTPTAIKCMTYITTINHVAITSTSGRLWLYSILGKTFNEISNNGIPILCIAHILNSNIHFCELWSGQVEGNITINCFNADGKIEGQNFVSHYDCENENKVKHEQKGPIIEKYDVFQIVAGSFSNDSSYIWSYLYPGCIVYQWDVNKRVIINKLDCSKLAPCSESLMSISIEEHLNPVRCQVTAIAIVEEQMELYIGTTWGCIIIVEANTMRPITIFRPYEEEIKAILPFKSKTISRPSSPSHQNDEENVNQSTRQQNLDYQLATIGKGYRNLLNRYVNIKDKEKSSNTNQQKNLHAILWSTQNWSQN